jgi:phage terminase large subunit GpA-like protein
LVLVDERDRMGYDTGGEGDPVTLAEARASTFPDGKVLVVSTPTIEGESPVWAAYLESTQHQWNWPCPDCGEYFVPRFELLKWPEDCTAFDALQAAYLECPHCAAHISDDHRHAMNSRGVFATTEQSITRTGEVNGDINPNTTAGFWVSGLCSPWRSFGQRAKVWLEASRSGEVERMQAVMNTALGELWKTAGERPAWETVAELKQPYQIDTVPSEVKILTCGVDVQANRIIYAVRGWGVGTESWGIAHGEFWGETAHPQVWENLSDLLEKTWGKKQIGLMLVDSGFKPGGATAPTHRVYDFCRQWRGRVSATKGHATQDRPLYLSKVDVAVRGQVIKGGLSLWHLNTDFFKQWVHARIDWPKDQRGGWHISEGHTDDYCKQVVSESRYASSDGKVKWIKHGENHYFDCEVLNTAAAHVVQAHLLRAKETPVQASPEMPEEKQAILRSTRPAAGGGRSNFAKSW